MEEKEEMLLMAMSSLFFMLCFKCPLIGVYLVLGLYMMMRRRRKERRELRLHIARSGRIRSDR